MVSKVRNFWLCVFSGVVDTTLINVIVAEEKKRKKSSSAITARYSLPQRTKQWTCKRQAQESILNNSVDIEIFHESRTTAICNVNDTLSTS